MRKCLLPVLAFSTLLAGCAGIDPNAVSSVSLNFHNPSSDFNGALSQMITAASISRTIVGSGVGVTVTETPGPTGVTSRIVRTVIANATVGTEYALLAGGDTYVEVEEDTSLGARIWRSTGGKLTLTTNDATGTTETLTEVHMEPYAGTPVGTDDITGTIAVRF